MLRIRSILFPTDFSPCAERAYNHAVHLARRLGAKLHVLSVVYHEDDAETSPMSFLPLGSDELAVQLGLDPIPVVAPDLQARSLQALEALAADEIPPSQPFDCTVLIGHAGHDIVEFADDRDADMIVIATHGLTGLKRLLMGSVTEQVVRAAACPVFTVRSFESANMATRSQTEDRYEIH